MSGLAERLLTVLIVLPLVAAVGLLFVPRQNAALIRRGSVGLMIIELGASLLLLRGDYSGSDYQFAVSIPWIERFGISYNIGVDGISLWLVLLTTLMSPIALYASWGSIKTKLKEYAIAFLILESAMIGTFVALDLFLFYVFWELMLIPMYLIIGVWGGPKRVYAAVKFFLYTSVGSVLMLVAILYLVIAHHDALVAAGVVAPGYTFALSSLLTLQLPFDTQYWLFGAFALAFAIKVPMFPLHTWLPDAHVEAPTGGSVILAAVLLKMGTYGFVRFAMPLFPAAAHWIGPSLASIAVLGILWGAWCAWQQKDLKKLVAYSSVSHLGFVMLGLFAVTTTSVSGAVLQMVNHGISTGALFLLVGVLYDRRHTRDLDQFGGLAKVMPIFTVLFLIVTLSSVGLPGTNGFIGEFMILAGSFGTAALGRWAAIQTIVATLGVIFSAVYMLYAVMKVFWGKVERPANERLPDVNRRELIAIMPLLVLVFWIGLFPNTFLEPMTPSVRHFVTEMEHRTHLPDVRTPFIPTVVPARPGGGDGPPAEVDARQARLAPRIDLEPAGGTR